MHCCLKRTMPDFFAESITNGIARFTDEDSRHAVKSLRLKEGEALHVSFKGRRYLAKFEKNGDEAAARILEEVSGTEPKTRITLYQGWPKGDKMEQIVKQSTELGVHKIVPVLFSRCVARPEGSKRIDRLNRIAREAAMQSGRTMIPQVDETVDFKQLQHLLKAHELALVPYEMEKAQSLRDVYKGAQDIALVIGPEGGLSETEVKEMGACPLSLGPRIMRTETAGIAAIAMILALNNDF